MSRVQTLARRAAGAGLAALAALGVAEAAPVPASPAAAKPSHASATKAAAASTTKGMEWVPTHEEALTRAKKEHKLVLLDFYTDWCGWCKRLDKDVFAQDSFVKAADGVLAVKVNAEKRPDLAQRYQVNSYPKLFFLNSEGVTVERIRGYLSLMDFTDRVNAVKAGDTEFARLRTEAMDPTNLPAIYRFARYLSDDRQHEPGIQYWQQVHDLSLQQLFQNPSAQAPMNYHREALVELANGYLAVGLDDAARQNYDEVLRVYSDNPMSASAALLGLAKIELKKPAGKAKGTEYLTRVAKEYAGTPAAAEAAGIMRSMQAAPAAAAK